MAINIASKGNCFLLVDSDGVKVIFDTGKKIFLTLNENVNQIIFKTLVCKMQIDTFSETYRHEIMAKLENSSYILANRIPRGILDKINKLIYCKIPSLDKNGEQVYAIA